MPTGRGRGMNSAMNPVCTAADRRTSRSCNPDSKSRPATHHTNKGHTTKDPRQTPKPVPNKNPSTASRRQNPNLPNPTRGPNHDPANRLANHHHRDRSSRGEVRRNRTRLYLVAKRRLTGQKNANVRRHFRRCERRGLSCWPGLRNCALRWNARNYPRCRKNATGHR